MKIALISREFDGVASGGGIGTYVRQASRMLCRRGHQVHIFTVDTNTPDAFTHPLLTVHRVAGPEPFETSVIRPIMVEHRRKAFDVAEAAEFGADAEHLKANIPDLPFVVKLHTPTYIIEDINNKYVPLSAKARYLGGGLKRLSLPRPFWRTDLDGPEKWQTLSADLVVATSEAIKGKVCADWHISPASVPVVPLIFEPSRDLLDIEEEGRGDTVVFVGKIEVRKGVLELAAAINLVQKKYPSTKFIFLGRSNPQPGTGRDMLDVVSRRLGRNLAQVSFPGAIPYNEIASYLRRADICVFPSIWENSPFACREAMAAARAVVASQSGGIPEFVDDGDTGLLVCPTEPAQIAEAICRLLGDRTLRLRLGKNARQSVSTRHLSDVIAPLQEASYERAVGVSRSAPWLSKTTTAPPEFQNTSKIA